MNGNGNGNGGPPSAWRWVAALLATIMLAGAPGILYAVRTWGLNGEVEIIRERQDDVRIRLSVLETENKVLQGEVQDLRTQLAQHVINEANAGGTP